MTHVLHSARTLLNVFDKLGVPLLLLKADHDEAEARINRRSPANFGGIEWKPDGPSTVIWTCEETKSSHDLCALIHELAHVMVRTDPRLVHEVKSAMLAVEASLHDFCEISPSAVAAWMKGFTVDASGCWHDVSWSRRLDIMLDSRTRAVSMGLLNRRGEILWKR